MGDENIKRATVWCEMGGGRPFKYFGDIREDNPERILIFDFKLHAIVEIPRRSVLQIIFESQPAGRQHGV